MAKLTQAQRLDRTHVALLRNDLTLPLSGILMLGTSKITNDPRIPTACTDGANKMYDEKFFASLDDAEARALVMHENIHVLFKHITVWDKLWEEDARTANKAADYVVNGFINKLDPSGEFLKPIHKDPGVWLQDDKYDNMDVGQVYRLLKKEQEKKEGGNKGAGGGTGGKPGAGNGSQGDSLDMHDWEAGKALSAQEVEALSKEIDQAMRQGAIVAGKASRNENRVFGELLSPKVDWRKVLREFVTTHCDGRDESTWRRPNRRWLQHDMYMPSMQGVSTGEIVVAIDTSGSTYVGGMLEKFLSELGAVATATNPEKLHVLYWEHTVAAHEVYEQGQMDNIIAMTKPKGGGGTTTSCVTAYMRDKGIKPKAAIVLTDGHVGNDWGGEWPCPVLWVLIGNKHAKPSVGVVVHAEE